MPTERRRAVARPPLLLDTDRVISTPGEFARRLPGFVRSSRARTTWTAEERRRLFTAANLLAYHAARSLDAGRADEILRTQLSCLKEPALSAPDSSAAYLAFDPFLNRIRLAAQTGQADRALAAIDAQLDGGPSPGELPASLGYGADLFTSADRRRLNRSLRIEKLLIAWRSGLLDSMDPVSAHELVLELTGDALPLRAELELRLLPNHAETGAFALRPDDTLKRALHRALVHIDALNPPPDSLLVSTICRGLGRLSAMSFVSPATARIWATTAHRWLTQHAIDCRGLAERAISAADERIAEAVAEDLGAVLGPAPPAGSGDDRPLGHTDVDDVVDLIHTAFDLSMKAAAHAH